MGVSLYVPLKEQENIKRLFRLMERNGLKEEKNQVMELADYIDSMEKQLGTVIEELGAVKEQLGRIQDKGVKQAAIKLVTKLEGMVEAAKQQLCGVKVKFMDGISRAVNDFKGKGVSALYKSTDVLGIKKGLAKFKEQLHFAAITADIRIERYANIGDELHEVKTHLGNVGRELIGKKARASSSRNVEKGMIFQIQKFLYHSAGVMKRMENHTDVAINKVMHLEDRANAAKKPSVRKSLKDIETKEPGKNKAVKVLEKAQESTR